ncbi:MAG TPA: tetratricopeptide repeat protein [Thermodesulfovibrionales bacterium]|nr:tetratricopeptide repeat protein [Thermodesulfovibrionales bacterium]
MADEFFLKAEEFRRTCRYREALSLYKKALKRYAAQGDSHGALSCLLSLGDTHRMTGDFDAAAQRYHDAIALSKVTRQKALRADAMAGLGLSLRALGDWKGALKLFTAAARVYDEKGDREGLAFLQWAQGGALRVGGAAAKAIDAFKKAKGLFESLGSEHKTAVGYCLCGLGGVSRMAGLWGDSLRYYTRANSLLGALHDRFGVAYSHCGIGNALRMKGDFSGALQHLRKAERVYRKIGDIVSYSYTLWSMGMTHLMEGRLARAKKCFGEAASRFKETKDIRGIIYCGLAGGQLLFLKGDVKRALAEFGKALAVSEAHEFMIEACHARALLGYAESGRADRTLHRKIGLRLEFTTIPFNIP